jgi:uncharacterized protein
VVTGQGTRADELLAAARKMPALDRIVLPVESPERLPPQHPARAKAAAAKEPAAFVCIGETCSLPVSDPAGLVNAIAAVRQS